MDPGEAGIKMNQSIARKQENRHLHLVRFERTPEEQAHLALTEGVYGLRITRGKKPRRFGKLGAGELFPLRILGRLTDDAVRAGCSEAEFTHVVMQSVGTLVREKFRKAPHQSGEFRPAA